MELNYGTEGQKVTYALKVPIEASGHDLSVMILNLLALFDAVALKNGTESTFRRDLVQYLNDRKIVITMSGPHQVVGPLSKYLHRFDGATPESRIVLPKGARLGRANDN